MNSGIFSMNFIPFLMSCRLKARKAGAAHFAFTGGALMATTSLWHIKGRPGDLIDYVENPEKTVPKGTEDFFNVFEYVRRPDKTTDQYVDAINCRKEIALQQMILTKKQYGKNDKYIAWHGYQSFKVGEISPDVAHEIGMKLANEMWGDRFQVVVTTQRSL